jgi:predicted AAA+ superfamily ATPase
VFRSSRPRGPLDAPAEIEALALEGLVAQHLRALCQLRPGGARLNFWPSRTGLEVDFVHCRSGLFQAIEVKCSRRVDRRHLKSLRAFANDHPEAELLLLSFCQELLLIDGIPCLPFERCLRELRP